MSLSPSPLAALPASAKGAASTAAVTLAQIDELNGQFERRWQSKFIAANGLSRSLVSFQSNKNRAVYRWFKYKEAFSADMVESFLARFELCSGTLLDPFAGSGTALFAASAMGMRTEGIELLPIGQAIIETKQLIDRDLPAADISTLERWANKSPWKNNQEAKPISEFRITKGAYPVATATAIGQYLAAANSEPASVTPILLFALLCVLESVSYTRKDGQYLRWDHRSGRRLGKKVFDKGKILSFDEAITKKLRDILSDIKGAPNTSESLFAAPSKVSEEMILHRGSCLELMPIMAPARFDCILTSPPYCNRYDYTRTYALELAMLGVDEDKLSKLRQEMLTCTVENRAKDSISTSNRWKQAIAAADDQQLLQAILSYLESQRKLGLLNNSGIPRMVRGYFYEMACVIAECARVLKRNAPLIMVNDNVRYAGAGVSVDIILSEIAERLGFTTESILVLPGEKGNSSQQMGAHGRDPLRKCVYIWRKQ